MAAAGNTLDESIGLITAANAVVQDPASVGTAFKTDFAYAIYVFAYRNVRSRTHLTAGKV